MGKDAGNIGRLGIMGGTFDPVHYGHLVTAEGARYELGLEKVIFVPAGLPPHKPGQKICEPRHRYAMVGAAVSSNPFFKVSGLELERPGPSYTIDTVSRVKELYPVKDIFFITGADAVLDILTWKDFELLLRSCRIVAATRPGYRMEEIWEKLEGIPEGLKKNIIPVEAPALAISSTDIRNRVFEGRPIKYLLPESVEDYIFKHNLYKK